MTPEKALQYAREDIAELRRASTHQDCLTLHTPIISYYRALLACGLISVAQQKGLFAQADAELASWQSPPNRVSHTLTDPCKGWTERNPAMPMTNADALSRARAMIDTIGTLSGGLAQYNAAQARYYIASLYDVGVVDRPQFEELMAANVKALNDWEAHHAAMNTGCHLTD